MIPYKDVECGNFWIGLMERVYKHLHRITSVLLVVAIFLAGFVVGQINSTSQAQDGQFAIGDTEQAFQPVYEVFEAIQARYVDASEVDVPMLVDGAITGMIDSLEDPFSSYMSAES